MVLAGKFKKKSSSGGGGGGEGWLGMDIFLVSFPEEDDHKQNLSSSTPSSSSSSSTIFKKAQSTISICALLTFFTFLLFTLSTIQPNNNNNNFISSPHPNSHTTSPKSNPRALQGLGTLYTRGTTSMNNLLLCHVTESLTTKQLQFFLRAFHRSGLPSNSDLVFIFPSISTLESFDNIILQENNFFLKIINQYKAHDLRNHTKVSDFPASFDPTRFVKSGEKVREKGEPIWGGKVKTTRNIDTESTRMSYGSVVGFGVGELDPENGLSGFVDKIPMSLRRWASYPMLLGRVRRSYKHVILVDVKKVLLLGDPLARVKNLTPDSVFFFRHHHHKTINPVVIMGGVRGVRRLSAAMLTEIVRTSTTQHNKRKKNSVTESGMLNRLAMNEFTLKTIRVVMTSAESIQETRSLGELGMVNRTIFLWRENRDADVESLIIMKHICSFPIDSTVYTDC